MCERSLLENNPTFLTIFRFCCVRNCEDKVCMKHNCVLIFFNFFVKSELLIIFIIKLLQCGPWARHYLFIKHIVTRDPIKNQILT